MPAGSGASAVTLLQVHDASQRERADKRRLKMQRNIVQKVIARYHTGRPGLPQLSEAQLHRLEQDVGDCMQQGTVSDSVINRLAAQLRRSALGQHAPRSESAPLPEAQPGPLPPLEHRLSGSGLTAEQLAGQGGSAARTPVCGSTVTSLVNPNSKLARSAKPGVIRRRENLVCDEQWNRLIQEDMQRYADEQVQQQREVLGKRRECRSALDRQVSEIKQMKTKEQEDIRRFAAEENARREKWLEEERQRQQERQERAQRERQQRDQLRDAERKAREEEQRRDKEEEQEYRRQLQEEVRKEAEAEQRKKLAHIAEYRKFMEFNKSELERKRAIQEREKQQDKAMLAAHAALLERQENQRKAELKKSQEKQAAKCDAFLKIYQAEQQKLIDEERRREQEMQRIAERQREEERAREERQRAGKRAFQQTLDEQLRSKQEEKFKEHSEQRAFRELQEQEVRTSIEFDAEQKEKRRLFARAHLGELSSQVAEKHEKNMRDIQVGIARQVPLPGSVRRAHSPQSAATSP
eukprot:TRINITY_DN56169_c0_g1_i1.p1 TRINITY_DN56169_c0_g1~~TRINITY_DN56169_c0_g1_i1.p1  ORF type:complete len:545 (+),score=235.12 TRINITY_DN56169_c0_g1_i1:68-1636(+)